MMKDKDTKNDQDTLWGVSKPKSSNRPLIMPMWELLSPYPANAIGEIMNAYGRGHADIAEALIGWHSDTWPLWDKWAIVKISGNWALRKGTRDMAYVGLDYPEQLAQPLNELITAEIIPLDPEDCEPDEEIPEIEEQYQEGLAKLLGYLEIPF